MAESSKEIDKKVGYNNEAFELKHAGHGNEESGTVNPNEEINCDVSVDLRNSSIVLGDQICGSVNNTGEWGNRIEFLMVCISTSVGLGNIWRFPITAYLNGGGVFLIPYLIVLFLVGKPFYLFEALLGQFTNRSCGRLWQMVPAMKGLGYAQIYIAFCIVTYYSALMALTIYYFIASFQSKLPWSYCRMEWLNECVDAYTSKEFTNFSVEERVRSSSELYFRRMVLNERESIENGIGLPSWELSLCLICSWISIFVVLCRGVKSTGKAAYFLAIFPYVVIIALLIRAVTLDGAVNGILFFITPKWDMLLKPTVWYAAITQCFFSLSVCFGPIITYSSHCNFNHNMKKDVMIITTLDTMTSFMAGCTMFGILGNLAHELGSNDISTVVRGGTGLAFISYPDALARFTFVPQLFAILFFIMLYILGVGSAVALVASIIAVCKDYIPNVEQWKLVLFICTLGYAVSNVYVTPGGQWCIALVDYYGGTALTIIIAVLEIITVFWIYGLTNFLNDVEFMTGERPTLFWRLCWLFITPTLMIIVLIYMIATYESPTYDSMPFPTYAYGIGWFVLALGILLVFIWFFYAVILNKSLNVNETFRLMFRPHEDEWGPSNIKIRKDWKDFIAKKKMSTTKKPA